MSDLFEAIYSKASDKCDPTQVKIDLNYACNLNCIHCYVDQNETTLLSVSQYSDFFDQLVELNTLRMVFTGGEPLLRPDFREIVKAASTRGFIMEVLTNATLMDEAMALFLRNHRVCEVQVSLHGSTPEMHDKITKVPGSFKKALQGIAHLKKAGIPVKLACNLLKSNYKYWREIKAFAEEVLKLQMDMSYWLVKSPSNEMMLPQCELSEQELTAYLTGLYHSKPFQAPTGDEPGDLDARICLAAINNCRLLPNGDVVPCARVLEPMGNILKDDFKTIWYGSSLGKQLRKLRRRDLKQCVQCEDYEICPICPGFSFYQTGDFLSAVDEVCQYVHLDGRIRRNMLKARESDPSALQPNCALRR